MSMICRSRLDRAGSVIFITDPDVIKITACCQAPTWERLLSILDRSDMAESRATVLQGTLDLLILKALSAGELHGLGVSRRIQQITKGTFSVQPGSLFPALHRLEEAGALSSSWQPSENNRRAKFYSLTKAGRRRLGDETAQWNRVALAIAH